MLKTTGIKTKVLKINAIKISEPNFTLIFKCQYLTIPKKIPKNQINNAHLVLKYLDIGVAITKMSLFSTVTPLQGHYRFVVIFLGVGFSVWLLPRRNSWLNFRMHPRERC